MTERIYSELVGDKFTEGLIPAHKKLEKKVSTHEIYFRVILSIGLLSGFIATFWHSIKEIFK